MNSLIFIVLYVNMHSFTGTGSWSCHTLPFSTLVTNIWKTGNLYDTSINLNSCKLAMSSGERDSQNLGFPYLLWHLFVCYNIAEMAGQIIMKGVGSLADFNYDVRVDVLYPKTRQTLSCAPDLACFDVRYAYHKVLGKATTRLDLKRFLIRSVLRCAVRQTDIHRCTLLMMEED